MNLSKFALGFALALSPGLASALTCPGIGQIEPNGDQVIITYSQELNLGYDVDYGSLVSMGKDESVYLANRWGTYITIPNTLLDGQVQSADVTFALEGKGEVVRACTAE